MNKTAIETSERKEVIKIGFEDVEIWPDYCLREGKDCRQCHFQGKIACHPRFRQGLKRVVPMSIDELLKQGKTPLEVQNITKAKIGTIYSRGQKLRRKGEIVRLRPPYPEGKKQEILRSVREHPEKEYKEIAAMLNVEPSYISRLCNKVGIHRRKMLDEKKEEQTKKAIEILKHNPQRSVASIADEFGLAPPTLITRLRKRGVLPIDHATRLVLDAVREEVMTAVYDALSKFFSERQNGGVAMFNIGDKVKIIKKEHFPRYVGLVGKIVWHNGNFELYQIETETKPPYYRPNLPPWIVTVTPDEIQLEKQSRTLGG